MFNWGVVLMVVGGLSFVLPIFGRQFVIVSALGLTGANSAVVGIVLFVIGFMLFNTSNRSRESESASPFSNKDVHKPVVTPAPFTAINKAKPTSASANCPPESKALHFTLPNGRTTDPQEFGVAVVKIGIGLSQQAVDAMIGNAELPSQEAISSRKGAVLLHMLALIVGVHYVCAYKLVIGNKQVLGLIGQGISAGFAALFSDESGKLSNANNPRFLYDLFQDYAKALADELDSTNLETLGSNPLDMGSTARLVVQNIGGQCGIQGILANSHPERMMLELIAAKYGETLLLQLLVEKKITYSS